MTDHKNHLDSAYKLTSVEDTQDFYAAWAATYDAEVADNGYATPARCTDALLQFVAPDAVVLDTGCGTGLSGAAFRAAGFSQIDGFDITPEMLEVARGRNLYRNLWLAEPGAPIDVSRGPYDVIAAIGVIGNGAAPLPFFHAITSVMRPKSKFVFSFNDHTLEHPEYAQAVEDTVSGDDFDLLFKGYGPHLPKRDMKSNVYVIERT